MPMHTNRSQIPLRRILSLHDLQSFFTLEWSRIWTQARRSRLRMTLTVCVLMLFCAACGTGSGTTTAGGGPPVKGGTISPSPVHVTPTSGVEIQKGYGTSQGCPDDTVVTKPVPAANVTVTMQDKTITARVGDSIEVRLPFEHRWFSPGKVPSVLAMQKPAGYASMATGNCIWRFTAMQKGNGELEFTGAPLCKPKMMCPMFVMLTSFSVAIH